MKKLYVGCSLLHAPEEFRAEVVRLKDELRNEYEVLEFVKMTEGTPVEVYQWDIHTQVKNCDLFLAMCDFPSLGLGYELGVAIEKYQKPTLGVAHSKADVSRLIRGVAQPHFEFVRYESVSDISALLRAFSAKH